MLILQEQYFHSSKTFLKVRTRQWENWLSKMYQDFWVFSEFTTQAFSHWPQPSLAAEHILENLQALYQFPLDSHLEVWIFMHKYIPSQL